MVNIEQRTERIFKIPCIISNTGAILSVQDIRGLRISNDLVYVVKKSGEFFTFVINADAIPKCVTFSDIQLFNFT